MNEKLNIDRLENTFYMKRIIKRSPNTPLMKTPYIKLKFQCKNLDQIKDFYYFTVPKNKSIDYRNELEKKPMKEENLIHYFSNPKISLEIIHQSNQSNKKLSIRQKELLMRIQNGPKSSRLM